MVYDISEYHMPGDLASYGLRVCGVCVCVCVCVRARACVCVCACVHGMAYVCE